MRPRRQPCKPQQDATVTSSSMTNTAHVCVFIYKRCRRESPVVPLWCLAFLYAPIYHAWNSVPTRQDVSSLWKTISDGMADNIRQPPSGSAWLLMPFHIIYWVGWDRLRVKDIRDYLPALVCLYHWQKMPWNASGISDISDKTATCRHMEIFETSQSVSNWRIFLCNNGFSGLVSSFHNISA